MKFKVGDRVIWSNVTQDTIMDYTDHEGKTAVIRELNNMNTIDSPHKITIRFEQFPLNDFYCSENELKWINSEKIKERLGVK